MFGKKKKKHNPDEEKKQHQALRISTIPDIFYGGKDPVIYHKKDAGAVEEKKAAYTKKATGGGMSTKKKKMIAGSVVLLVLVTAGISWYYIRAEAPQPAPRQIVQNTTPRNTQTEGTSRVRGAATSTPRQATSTESVLAPTTTKRTVDDLLIDIPPIIRINSTDLDADALTDREEEIFNTDSGKWDTDGDGYYDGQEVVNLYNPSGFAPVRLIDSGLVREYVNPTLQYRIYYPSGWSLGAVDAEARQVLFSDISGDYIEVKQFTKKAGENFQSWFGRVALGQKFTDLIPFTNRFKERGLKRSDDLVAYVEHEKNVFVLIYHPKGTDRTTYRHVMNMMVQSFRPTKSTIQVPTQAQIPGIGTTSTPATSTQETSTTTAAVTSTTP